MHENDGMLAPYRVLDLTSETGQPCGKLLADLGADVIKVEPPGGDPARRRAPFVDDDPDPEKGLYWLAYNANKRGVVLDLESPAGRARFERLATTADVVLESSAPGEMDRLGLSYERLAELNPGLVLVSITPFGQDGPYATYKGPDIVTWAMSGLMSVAGQPECPPAHLSDDAQSRFSACGDAAIAALLALAQRQGTGRGQHVDVAIRDAVARTTFQITATWDMLGRDIGRAERPSVSMLPWTWRCRDGYVVYTFYLGPLSLERNAGFIAWLESTGEADALLALDWEPPDPGALPPSHWDAYRERTAAILAKFAKAELFAAANDYGFNLYPSASADETLGDVQLAARDFWRDLEHEQWRRTIRYPGPFAKATQAPPTLRRRAPFLGEHQDEVLAELENALAAAPPARDSNVAGGAAAPLPLAGIKVADFSWMVVGPMTSQPLADYGADVIHVESSTRVDSFRLIGPHKDGIADAERCGDYAQVRTNQRSLTIDITRPEGLAVAKRLVAWADIVVDNFAAGTMERLGLGYDALRAVNPEVIVLSCCGQGQDGPHKASKGGGGNYVALAGFSELAGWPDAEPGYLSVYTDFIAPRFNVCLLLAALDYRRRTGKGQFFDVSQYETSLHWLAPSLLDYGVNGRVATRQGNRQPHAAPHGAYPCQDDRWCAIAVTTDDEWDAFRTAIGDPAWAHDARFATLAARKQHEDALDAHVETWTRERAPDAVMDQLQAAGVPAGAVQRGSDLMERDPQLKHRGFWQELAHPAFGTYRAPRHSFRLSDAPCDLRRSRLIGEDTHEILRDVLGYSDDEIGELAIAGVLQ